MTKLPNNRATKAYIDKLDKIRNNAPSRQSQALIEPTPSMPAKKTKLTDAERAKRIRETAREIGTDNDPESLERAFKKIVRQKGARQDRDAPKTSAPGRTSRLHQGLARACPGFITLRRRGFSLFYSRWTRSPRASWDG
jgi:hypothetical protein